MGFDTVICNRPLPDGFDASSEWLQTKEFECWAQTYTITEDGRLLGPDGVMDFHGWLNFYSSDRDYWAKFTDGALQIVLTHAQRFTVPALTGNSCTAAISPALSEELGLPVVAYDAGGEVLIEAAKQMDGRTLWKVRKNSSVLAKTGEWERELMPSGRDDDFLARCRFDTPQDALACLNNVRC